MPHGKMLTVNTEKATSEAASFAKSNAHIFPSRDPAGHPNASMRLAGQVLSRIPEHDSAFNVMPRTHDGDRSKVVAILKVHEQVQREHQSPRRR